MATRRRRSAAATFVWRALSVATGVVGLSGALVHTTVRDANPVLAALHYGLPLAACGAMLAISAFALARGRGHTRLYYALATLAVVLLGWWGHRSYETNPCIAEQDSSRLLLWNVSRGRATWEPVAAAAAKHDADLVAIVEADRGGRKEHATWRRHFPEHQLVVPGGGVVLLARGTVETTVYRRLRGISSAVSARVVLEGEEQPIDVVVADLDASPRFDKKALIGSVFGAGVPDGTIEVVMGDFNAPPSSRWFDAVRRAYDHAFEVAGRGWVFTWPRELPFLALDHVWVSRDWSTACTRILWNELSDHAQVVVDLAPAP